MLKNILTYTEEMKEQDKLWEEEGEDTIIMEKLFHQIAGEAKEKGFNGIVDIYQGPGEAIAEVYGNRDEMENDNSDGCYGYCKPLIEHLEGIISTQNTNLLDSPACKYFIYIGRRVQRITDKVNLINYVENNEDLFDQRGLSKEVFYNEIMGFIDIAYENQSPVTILTVKDSLEEIITFVIDEFVSEELTNDKLYDIFTEEDIYVYKLNETNQYILIKK